MATAPPIQAGSVNGMGARIVVVDNYDSFVYNLVQYVGELGGDPIVVRNDAVTVDEVAALNPDGILISPGPGRPEDAGISCAVIAALGPTIPLFGVCLGHQAIGHAFGGDVVRAPSLMHGKTSSVKHDGTGVLSGLRDPFTATRYHSLVIEPSTMPVVLEIVATTASDDAVRSEASIVMAVRHRTYPIYGVQFHPESILTESGHRIVSNFLELAHARDRG